jgi:hypothetical protein
MDTLVQHSVSRGFWSFAVPFVLGGFFFSAVVAAFGAVYAFGLNNVQKAWREVSIVARRVLAVLRAASAAAWAALLDDNTRWTIALKELREGFSRAGRVAAEGVEAISLERDLFAAAVGIPGLPLQQYIVDRLYSDRRFLSTALENSLREALQEVRNKRVRKLTLRKFEAGAVAPRLLAARAYDTPDALAFDVETTWESDVAADIDMVAAAGLVDARVPVACRRFRFEGPVRLIATPLIAEPPGYGALLVSLPTAPKIGLDVRVAGGEVTKLPWLKNEIETALQAAIGKELLWPNRIILPMSRQPKDLSHLLSRSELAKLQTTDPLLEAEKALAKQPAVSALVSERAPPRGLGLLVDVLVNGTRGKG